MKLALFFLAILAVTEAYTERLYVRPTAGGARVSWSAPAEPTSEYLLIWFKDGMGRIGGHKFIGRMQRDFTVSKLEPCTKYIFWLYGFDWNYEINSHAIGYLETAGCANDLESYP